MDTTLASKIEEIKIYLKNKELDYFDVRLENTSSKKIVVENKIVKNIGITETTGVGIRIIKNGKLGFCSSNNINNYKQIIEDCLLNLRKIQKKTKFENWEEHNKTIKKKFKETKTIEERTKEFLKINKETLKDKKKYKILQSNISYLELKNNKYFVNPDSFIYQEQPRVIFYSLITGKLGGVIENNMERYGSLKELEDLKINEIIKKNLAGIEEQLKAKPCPAKKTNIILTPNLVDLLAHEAIGHASEGDAVVNKSSVLEIGKKLSENKEITIVDNPLLKEFGHYQYDDEGTKAREKIIVKKGIVNDYLLDIESATKLGFKSTGNARADGFSSRPIVRMSNTYFLEGKDKLEDVLNNFTGYLLDGFSGGQVDPSVGTFMFGVKRAYEYKNGKKINVFKQASISGNILEYLKNVTAVTNKLGKFGFGFCGKDGQTAYVSGSGPYLKIDDVVLGGTKHE